MTFDVSKCYEDFKTGECWKRYQQMTPDEKFNVWAKTVTVAGSCGFFTMVMIYPVLSPFTSTAAALATFAISTSESGISFDLCYTAEKAKELAKKCL